MARTEETKARTKGEDTWLEQKIQRLEQEEKTDSQNRRRRHMARTEDTTVRTEDIIARIGEEDTWLEQKRQGLEQKEMTHGQNR